MAHEQHVRGKGMNELWAILSVLSRLVATDTLPRPRA